MGLNIVVGIEIFYPQINGIITSTMNLLKNFQNSGHNPIIITPRIVKNAPNEIQGIPVYYVPSTDALTYPGLRLVNVKHPIFKKIIEEHNIDIIQTTAPWFIAKGLHRIGKKKHIPMVSTFHTNLHSPGYIQYIVPSFINKYILNFLQWFVWSATKQFLNPCNLITAPSPHACHDLKKLYPYKTIKWIPNGIHKDMFIQSDNPELRKVLIPHLVQHKKPYVIFVGRHATEKSLDILLRGIAYVIKKASDFHLVTVGDGPKFSYYKKLAEKLHVANNVSFLGRIEHETLIHSGLIHKAKFFVSASVTEVHSMTVVEALCCGIPLVVPNHPSMTFFTEKTGHYFEPMNPESIGEALYEMWIEGDLYHSKKQQALTMLDKFDIKKIANIYIKMYQELLQHTH